VRGKRLKMKRIRGSALILHWNPLISEELEIISRAEKLSKNRMISPDPAALGQVREMVLEDGIISQIQIDNKRNRRLTKRLACSLEVR
jgi:hypothetical protein